MNSALNELRLAYARAHELCGPLFELEAAIEYLKELAVASKQAKQELEEGRLFPLPGTLLYCTVHFLNMEWDLIRL